MPKNVEKEVIQGDKFILVGFFDDLINRGGDFFQISENPVIKSFENENLWFANYNGWSKSNVFRLAPNKQNLVNHLNTSKYILIAENQYMQLIGENWISMLHEVSPDLANRFSEWERESGNYSFRYKIDDIEHHKSFNTELSKDLELILIEAIRRRDEKVCALSYHLYELAIKYSSIPKSESYLVMGAYCNAMDKELGLPIAEKRAKLDKIYRSHKKWSLALKDYLSRNNL